MKFIFPSFFTILNLVSGFVGVLFLLDKNYDLIDYCIYLSLVFDFLDGFIARKLNATSKFGKHLDSFADLISFGLLPSLILYDWFSINSSIDIYKYTAGLTITLLPPANAGAIFQANIISGKFQGNTQPTTPNGSRVIKPTESAFAGET